MRDGRSESGSRNHKANSASTIGLLELLCDVVKAA